MIKNIISLLLIAGIIIYGCSPSLEPIDEVKKKVANRFNHVEGDFAIAFKSLEDSSNKILINEREMFHAASTMKTPVMIEVFRQEEQGLLKLFDSLLIRNEFRSIVDSSRYSLSIENDSEDDLYNLIGKKRSIRHLVEDMITASSNLATNILIERVGAKRVTETMRNFGADSIIVLRGVEDLLAYEQGLSNRTTALDLMIIFEKLGRGEAVNSDASDRMVEILKRQQFNEMIPAGVPENVEVAHKTGWITGVHHDSGLILLPDGRKYVLVLLSKNAPDREAVLNMFSDISALIYKHMISGRDAESAQKVK